MLYQGEHLQLDSAADGIYKLIFNDQKKGHNILSSAAVAELQQVLDQLESFSSLKGLILSSAMDEFILGADVTEFGSLFHKGPQAVTAYLDQVCQLFNRIEELPCPTVVLVAGQALGGGFELCLACDFRLATATAHLGLPELKLGIIPGFGGTVRLPRLIGLDHAMEVMTQSTIANANHWIKLGAVDAILAAEELESAALQLIDSVQHGERNVELLRRQKVEPLALSQVELAMSIQTAKGLIAQKVGRHYPAPWALVGELEKSATQLRNQALELEHQAFVKASFTPECQALVGIFLNSQHLKKVTSEHVRGVAPVHQAGVLGAGIMGGGIAYQSALKGIPVIMRDIREEALVTGMEEAIGHLKTGFDRGKLSAEAMAQAAARIHPTLRLESLEECDLVVEAVVEKLEIKQQVLAEVDQHLPATAVITSNTSTISINLLAQSLNKPERFCGMHFFNPVHKMPLVEVIRGAKTSDETVGRVVAYASAMGKTPVVVHDCPGFFVNRVLYPYFFAFDLLLRDGVEPQRIDKVMEGFGWPMGPAYLQDVVGIDTCFHAAGVMARGFPDRMVFKGTSALELLFQAKRLGQKNALGFYRYEKSSKGKPRKLVDPDVQAILAPILSSHSPKLEIDDETLVMRMMLPLCLETLRCLHEGIVSSVEEADMALVMGIGFPPFRGGVFRYMQTLGLDEINRWSQQLAELGPLYQAPSELREMQQQGRSFYVTSGGAA